MKSKYMTLSVRDFMWGLFYSLIPIATQLGKVFSSGKFPSQEMWFSSAMQSIPIIAVYLVVHFFKNSKGSVGPEKMK